MACLGRLAHTHGAASWGPEWPCWAQIAGQSAQCIASCRLRPMTLSLPSRPPSCFWHFQLDTYPCH